MRTSPSEQVSLIAFRPELSRHRDLASIFSRTPWTRWPGAHSRHGPQSPQLALDQGLITEIRMDRIERCQLYYYMIQSMASNIYLPQMCLSLPLHIVIHVSQQYSSFLCSKYHQQSLLAVHVFGDGGQLMTVQTKCKSMTIKYCRSMKYLVKL